MKSFKERVSLVMRPTSLQPSDAPVNENVSAAAAAVAAALAHYVATPASCISPASIQVPLRPESYWSVGPFFCIGIRFWSPFFLYFFFFFLYWLVKRVQQTRARYRWESPIIPSQTGKPPILDPPGRRTVCVCQCPHQSQISLRSRLPTVRKYKVVR